MSSWETADTEQRKINSIISSSIEVIFLRLSSTETKFVGLQSSQLTTKDSENGIKWSYMTPLILNIEISLINNFYIKGSLHQVFMKNIKYNFLDKIPTDKRLKTRPKHSFLTKYYFISRRFLFAHHYHYSSFFLLCQCQQYKVYCIFFPHSC